MPRNSRPRPVVHALAGLLVAASVFGCGAPDDNAPADDDSPAAIPDKPSKPVALEILDVAGNLQLTQPMIDDFVEQNPDIVSKVSYDKAPAPDLAGKIKAQQQADRVQIDLVLTGTDGLAAGISQNLWTDMSAHEKAIGGAPDYLEPAADMQELAQGKGTVLVYYPSGPLIQYSPGKVTDPPGSPQELLAWAKENPKKFQYADPANSGPGRTFLMGLPHLLGDKDPKDPKSWDKTWKYLKELDKYIDNYASGTTETMQNLADGQVDMVATTTGWYINPRALGTVPKDVRVAHFHDMTWVTDAQYAVVPRGVDADTMSAVLRLIKWMLTPEQQAKAYDDGYFYPGPAVKDVPLEMAPEKSQQVIEEYGAPELDTWIEEFPKQPSLPAEQQVEAFDMWNREVASQ
ncbi:ABC transporter substrate-binding protein [Streptomyces sp. Ru87]|uniref:ABC transporter substrate-binding protein n=1 Tax=Streptomyces sp. Ru87 TaxID=2044307 RepID=UPI000BF96B63|nr:extracellular solute-binding protein [Streptomyces sp. Ru87]PGH52052.1 ABC transporter substrate-binding protein [Streptomyces sp. Ru87]